MYSSSSPTATLAVNTGLEQKRKKISHVKSEVTVLCVSQVYLSLPSYPHNSQAIGEAWVDMISLDMISAPNQQN